MVRQEARVVPKKGGKLQSKRVLLLPSILVRSIVLS